MPRIESITRKQVLELLEQQSYRCALTGWELTPETASIDHRIPLAKGGDHTIENAQIVDWRVNQAKGTMTNEEFGAMCAAVATAPTIDRTRAIEKGNQPAIRDEPMPGEDLELSRMRLQLAGLERRLAGSPTDEHLLRTTAGIRAKLEREGVSV